MSITTQALPTTVIDSVGIYTTKRYRQPYTVYTSGSQTFSNRGTLAKSRFFQGSQCRILRSVLYETLAKRLQAKAEADKCLGEDQFGFRKGRGTRDAIGALRMLTERSLEHKQEVYICFVDYEKAFDRVDWKKLINALRRMGVDWRE